MAMLGLSRFCEDLIIYNTYEFSFINIDDSFCTGSSIMPQKKNPDVLELIRGKSALVTGNLMQVFMLLKGLPSTYNSDMQEDKKIFFNSYRETIDSLVIFNRVLEKIGFNGRNIADSASSGFMEATDAADYLVKKGESFRNAHNIIGRLVRHCIDNGIKLQDMAVDKLKEYSKYFDTDFYSSITVSSSVAAKSTTCGTSPSSVKKMLLSDRKTAEKLLKEINIASEQIPDLDEILSGRREIAL
jgi:argininosuccinate lyase